MQWLYRSLRNSLSKEETQSAKRQAWTSLRIGHYSRLHFLRAISHSLGAHTHTEAFQFASDDNSDDDDDVNSTPSATATANVTAAAATATPEPDMCEVCRIAPRSGVDFVPCRHSRFREPRPRTLPLLVKSTAEERIILLWEILRATGISCRSVQRTCGASEFAT